MKNEIEVIKNNNKKREPAHGGPLKVRTWPLGACVAGTILGPNVYKS